MKPIEINTKKKIFFISDAHLGISIEFSSLEREKRLVKLLDTIKDEAEQIFLLGDIFDFWFEYKSVVSRGFVRILGKLAEISDAGITINFFTGNHDMWTFSYLQKEIGMNIFRKPQQFIINNKKYLIGHGDGLGPGNRRYKLLKRFFASKFCQWIFARLHPNFAFYLAKASSNTSRYAHQKTDLIFKGDKELLVKYAKKIETREHFDYYIFGHRHIPIEIKLNDNSKYFNIGDWISYFSYLEIDDINVLLKKFK